MKVSHRYRAIGSALTFLSLLGSATASEISELPTDYRIVGQATLSVLFWDIYTATLFTPSGTYPPKSNKLMLTLSYLRDIDSDELIDATEEQWQRFNVSEHDQSKWTEALSTIWPDIKKGDSLTFVMHPNASYFYYNSKHVGNINDPAFGPAFADIWLSDTSEYPKIQKKLIGLQ